MTWWVREREIRERHRAELLALGIGPGQVWFDEQGRFAKYVIAVVPAEDDNWGEEDVVVLALEDQTNVTSPGRTKRAGDVFRHPMSSIGRSHTRVS